VTIELAICEFGTNTRRPSSVASTVCMSEISTTVPVTSAIVTRSPSRTDCDQPSSIPEPMFESGPVSAMPMKIVTTAVDASRLLASASVAGNTSRMLQTTIASRIAVTSRRRITNRVRWPASSPGERWSRTRAR
jgi:hypothetical protein